MRKNFIAIKFENRTHAVVPSHWLTESADGICCKWPADDSDIDSLSKSNAPASDHWSLHKVLEVMTESSEYFIVSKIKFEPNEIKLVGGTHSRALQSS